MTDCRRAENTCLLRWQLRPLTAAILALSATPLLAETQAPGYGQDSIAGLPVYAAEESAATRSPSLPDIDSAGDRLGWMTREEIAELPAMDRPALDETCEGAWVTPISPSVVA